jgi:hypothetical protein
MDLTISVPDICARLLCAVLTASDGIEAGTAVLPACAQ